MATEVRVEESMGIDRCVIQTITTQDLSAEPAKNPNARSYRAEHVDGVYTLVEEFLLEQGAPQFAFSGSIGTEPLETHPLFNGGAWDIPEDLKKNWATYKKNPTDAFLIGKGTGTSTDNPQNLWQPAKETDSAFAAFYAYIKKGVESYYVGRVTVRMTVLEEGAPDMSLLGKIDSQTWPDGFTPPGNSNFILSGVTSQQEGDFFRTTYEYMSSAGGSAWDVDLYQES